MGGGGGGAAGGCGGEERQYWMRGMGGTSGEIGRHGGRAAANQARAHTGREDECTMGRASVYRWMEVKEEVCMCGWMDECVHEEAAMGGGRGGCRATVPPRG